MGKRCPSCGACQECGHGGHPVYPGTYPGPSYPVWPQPWWGVIPPYQVPVMPTTWGVINTITSGGTVEFSS